MFDFWVLVLELKSLGLGLGLDNEWSVMSTVVLQLKLSSRSWRV